MTLFARRLTRRSTLIAAGAAGVLAAATRRALLLSAEPADDPECYPQAASGAHDSLEAAEPAPADGLHWTQQGGYINDASCLNRTPVHGVVQVRDEEELRAALRYAREQGRKVSVAGVRHSMGGQAFYRDALVLDMTRFNRISLDEASKTITAQSGATWHQIQDFLHPRYAVKAMQSTDIFTVGGSISVNAHGMDHQVGAIGKTIRGLRLMQADGTVQRLAPDETPELFGLVVGGYGLFGVIVDAELEITDNVIYAPGRRWIDYQEFPALFAQELMPNPKLGLMYGHLSTAPQSLLREMILYTYEEQPMEGAQIPPLGEVSNVKLRRLVLNLSKQGSLPMRLKWFAEKHIEPRLESCTVTRAQAMQDGEACLVSRNEPMHDSVKYLRNNLPGETDILHEYFIPREQFVPFVDGLRALVQQQKVNLLNASVRVVHREENFLTYAPADMFSVVLYINQRSDEQGNEQMRRITGALIDLTTALGGRFFLPYQLHYTPEQLAHSYPEIGDFFAAKRRYDPDLLFTNTFYEKYAPSF
ncbi:MAG TPA: FAD-binding oxidoreductase [Caldilineaceae bacterium]|nr:FAD-binding oxidoreductase [Caldilineaceae bacterium]